MKTSTDVAEVSHKLGEATLSGHSMRTEIEALRDHVENLNLRSSREERTLKQISANMNAGLSRMEARIEARILNLDASASRV